MSESKTESSAVKASCHCGAVVLTAPEKAKDINECQCTICRRYGAAWAYYDPKTVKKMISTPTRAYVWGDKNSEFHCCSICGCVTHWQLIREGDRMGINTRMMNPDDIAGVTRRVTYDVLMIPLKAKDRAHPEDKALY